MGVIDYYEDGLKDAKAEWHTHNLEREQIAYNKHLQECAEAAANLAASKNALPRPPQ